MTLPSSARWGQGPSRRQPGLTLGDIAGMTRLVGQLRTAVVERAPREELRAALGAWPRTGAILFGPPDCGEAQYAEAIAGELGCSLVSLHAAGPDNVEHRIGGRVIRRVFELARREGPTVLLLHELTDFQEPSLMVELTQQLDHVSANSLGLVVLGTTSHPWDLDPALLRPGRLDRRVFIPPPDAAARRDVLGRCLLGRSTDEGIDLAPIVAVTGRCSTGDLRRIVDLAAEAAMIEHLDRQSEARITQRHLLAAASEVPASTPAWIRRARTHALYADPAGLLDEMVAGWSETDQ